MRRIIILLIVILIGVGYTMAQENSEMAQKPPQPREVVLSKDVQTKKGYYNTSQAAYKAALREAQQEFPQKSVGIRNLAQGKLCVNSDGSVSYYYTYTIVELPGIVAQKMYEAIGKVTIEIEEGNRFALDKLSITDGKTDKIKTKGQIVDYLIGKGYKVVAKESMEKLYKEQQGQQSGIYNSETTVEGNNFSAVGHFISIYITKEYVQVQVVNVSTGEYEGNVTVNL